MVLSSPSKIFDPIRNTYLVKTPEEEVRQSFIQRLMDAGYPKELIRLEVAIDQFSAKEKKVRRRADILCFTKKKDLFMPLLLVECKAVKITGQTKAQVLGYNCFFHAKSVCIVNQEELYFGLYDESGQMQFAKRFYSYEELLQKP